ncbi:MAG: PDDEXK nuclease domain-containing protein [Cyanobacteria bacterium P01_H01_bin.21]
MSNLTDGQYQQLIHSISDCLANGQQLAVRQANQILIETYQNIDRYIVEFEQQGQKKTEYGSQLLTRLSKDLEQLYGKELSRRNLLNILNGDRSDILDLVKQRQEPTVAKDVVKDPYVFEFLELPEQNYRETELENRLIEKLEQFLLELGKGFAFIGQQYRITLNNTHFYVDLVFYHRILKCFVLIDLKTRSVNHQDIGQMNLYLNYFKAEENVEDDNEPIGIVLATDRDEIMVEYATGSISNQLFVSRYQLYLPDVEVLKAELRRLLES